MKLGKFHLQEVHGEELKFYIQLILDQYTSQTKKSIALYDSENEEIWSNTISCLSPVCRVCRAHVFLKDLCFKNHTKRASVQFHTNSNEIKGDYCYLGLFNFSAPIVHKDKFYGSILSGQLKCKTKASEKIFNSAIDKFLETKSISIDAINSLRMQYKAMKKASGDNKIKNEIEKVSHNLIRLVEYIDSRLNRRLRRITDLRHEIHLPNKALQGNILRSIKLLEESLASEEILETKKRIEKSLRLLAYANNYSELFSNTIENIILSFTKDTVAVNITRCVVFDILAASMKVFEKDAADKYIDFKQIEKKNIQTISIEADYSLLRRVFTNVYQNAVKYSFAGSPQIVRWIETKCYETHSHFVVEVQNYGIGILAEEISSGKIWKEGVRGKLSGDRHRIGTGTGLYIIKKFITALNGEVEIASIAQSNNKITGPYLTTLTIKIPFFQGKRQ